MNGDEEAFRLMMATPSDQVRVLTYAELQRFGLAGEDPAWEEYGDAETVRMYGPLRNAAIKACLAQSKSSDEVKACEKEVFVKYPIKQ